MLLFTLSGSSLCFAGENLINSQDKHVVLLLANDYETMEILEQTFARAGFRVFGASNLEQAVSAIELQVPDIVVCDSAIKDFGRENLQENMPEDLDLETIPFIYLCTTGPGHEPGRYLDLNQYFNKPFDPIALATLAERTLAYRQSLVESAQADAPLSVIARKVLRKEVLRELNRVQRYGGYVSLCLFDILEQQTDKPIQAKPIEPIVLDRIGDFLPGMIRTVDLLARLTRRRFLWIMPGTDGHGSHLAVARLVGAFGETPIVEACTPLVMHAGLATAPDDGLSYEELLELAQQELTQRPIVPAQASPQQKSDKWTHASS